MIKSISLNGVATYRQPTTLTTDKKINLIYGLNGTGKSTLSKYLYDIQDERYKYCFISASDALDAYEFLVYNTRFVEDNFYEKNAQKGIFTLSKENKKIEEKIEKLEEKIAQYKILEETINAQIESIDGISKGASKQIEQKVWESKLKYFNNDPVIQEMIGKGFGRNMETYFEMVKIAKYDANAKDVLSIKSDYEALSRTQEKIPFVSSLEINLTKIEKDPILQKQIVGSSNSTISSFIERLKNTDWVKNGRSYLKLLNNKVCPFCQRDGISDSFIEELEKYFDDSYERDVECLKNLLSDLIESSHKLNAKQTELKTFFEKYGYFASELEKLSEESCSKLKDIINSNIASVSQKINEPSIVVVLRDSSYSIASLNSLINDLNGKIQEFNDKIDHIDVEKKSLRAAYWAALHKEYHNDLEKYIKDTNDWDSQIKEYKKILENRCQENKKVEDELASLRKQVSNVDEAIENINGKLEDVGLGHLKIVKYQENADSEPLYRVVRNGENETDFKSLSEGEKMMVTFLYFVERCKGAATNEGSKKKKIVVIDDPISSLSHIFVYNVALIINGEFTGWNRLHSKNEHGADGAPYPYEQVFILTHNLYFYYELVERDGDRRKEFQELFRIQKKNNVSSIVPLKYNEIHNDYQAYWTIVKNKDQADHPLLANCMRNILEYFFVFAENRDLSIVFQRKELSANKFQSFYRYINRESHSVGQNACDTKEFDYEELLDLFRQVFEVTNYKTHYETMMKIK